MVSNYRAMQSNEEVQDSNLDQTQAHDSLQQPDDFESPPSFVRYDVHLECVLHELTKYAKNLERETMQQNLQLQVVFQSSFRLSSMR